MYAWSSLKAGSLDKRTTAAACKNSKRQPSLLERSCFKKHHLNARRSSNACIKTDQKHHWGFPPALWLAHLTRATFSDQSHAVVSNQSEATTKPSATLLTSVFPLKFFFSLRWSKNCYIVNITGRFRTCSGASPSIFGGFPDSTVSPPRKNISNSSSYSVSL